MKIKLWMDLNAAANASRYYKRAKELEEEAIKKRPKLKRPPKEWYEHFRWSFGNSGELILIGKNQEQNIRLVRKYAIGVHWLCHADIPGAATVLLLGDRDLKEAAQLAGVFSSAWKRGYAAADVYAFKKEQINFSGPLMKGTYQIIGERQWFRNVPLGLKLALDEKNRLNIYSLFSRREAFAEVYPGREKKERVARELEKTLGIDPEDALALLPEGLRLIWRI